MPVSTDETKNIVRRYHEGWSNGRFDDAIALLADDLRVEVPVNCYPTRESFARALVTFGGMVEQVELLSELAGDDEAMLLYDLTVKGLGPMRIVEHFTVKNARIVRLRQIHDTFAIRVAGLGS